MGNYGKCDFSDLIKLEKQLSKISDKAVINEFIENSAKELAQRLYNKVLKRTPVGKNIYCENIKNKSGKEYKRHTYETVYENIKDSNGNDIKYKRGKNKGKIKQKKVALYHQGSTLRKNWSVKEIVKNGTIYQILIINPTEYASYVEYGHRQKPGRFVPIIGKRLKKSWVKGRFMLTISEEEVRTSAPKILERKVKEYLRRCFID